MLAKGFSNQKCFA